MSLLSLSLLKIRVLLTVDGQIVEKNDSHRRDFCQKIIYLIPTYLGMKQNYFGKMLDCCNTQNPEEFCRPALIKHPEPELQSLEKYL